jgi:hypothetical protein
MWQNQGSVGTHLTLPAICENAVQELTAEDWL